MLVEINENFTAKDKRIITNDWNEYFKSLKRFKILALKNRVGPLVVGIWLKMGRLGACYKPVYTVHGLCRETPYADGALTLTLGLEGRRISPQEHNAVYIQEAQELKKKAYIPIEGDVRIDEVIDGYKRFFKTPFKSGYREYQDFVLICGLTRERKRIEEALNFVYNELKTWEDWRFGGPDGFENMFKNLEQRVWDPDELERVVESEIIKHKLEKLPVRKILF